MAKLIKGINGESVALALSKQYEFVAVPNCKDCQYSEPCKPYNKVWCPKMGRYMKQDGFCSEGKVKE